MSNRPLSMNRRQLLRTASGLSLALPFLPSLLSAQEAEAQSAAPVPKLFVQMQTDHGGAARANMFPSESALTTKQTYAGHEIRMGNLQLARANGRASLSPILSADATVFTDALAAKMNVIEGLDVPFYIAHNTGMHLGNYARNDGNGGDGVAVQKMPCPTVDQVMAYSTSFYSDLSSIKERYLYFGGGGGRSLCWNYSNASARLGDIVAVSASLSAREWFNKIFVSDPTPTRKPIVDRVLQDYLRLRQGNRRLSSTDRSRLDDYMDRLNEIERRLNVRVSCGSVQPPATDSINLLQQSTFDVDPGLQAQAYQLFNDVITAAFLCGTSRIAVVQNLGTMSDYKGDWHQEVAHQHNLPDKQAILSASYQRYFEQVFFDLVRKLDAAGDGTGKTLLDHALVVWTHESGAVTHENQSVPVITAGSAGGFLQTGRFCDYRNRNDVVVDNKDGSDVMYSGLIFNQWLGTLLQAMGLQRSEYERNGNGGYGVKYIGDGRASHYPDSVFSVMGEVLPFLT